MGNLSQMYTTSWAMEIITYWNTEETLHPEKFDFYFELKLL